MFGTSFIATNEGVHPFLFCRHAPHSSAVWLNMQFFISPLISEDGVEREVNAVDSECAPTSQTNLQTCTPLRTFFWCPLFLLACTSPSFCQRMQEAKLVSMARHAARTCAVYFRPLFPRYMKSCAGMAVLCSTTSSLQSMLQAQ